LKPFKHNLMNQTTIYLIIVSYLTGFLFLLLIRWYDKYDREPLWRLIFFSFLGGLSAILIASFIYLFVHPKFNFEDAILKIGSVEEFSKLITLFVLYKIIQKEFDEIVDGIIYVAAVSLGFSVIENIFYAMHAPYPYALLFKRFLFATIGHISFSVYMGIAFYVHKKIQSNYTGLLLAFVLSTLAHGLYDGVLFEPELIGLFLPVYLLLIYFQFRLLKVAYAFSKMKLPFKPENFVQTGSYKNIKCCNCNYTKAETLLFDNRIVYRCENCNHIILEKNLFEKLLKYYRPKFLKKYWFTRKYQEEIIVFNKKETAIYDAEKQRINAPVHDLHVWFQTENCNDLKQYLQTLEGRVFKQLGFKYLVKK